MPVLDGCEATRQIKATPRGRATPIIALTASSFEEECSDVRAAGCDDLLRKPFHEADLFALLEKHLGVSFVYEDEPESPRPVAEADLRRLAALPPALRSPLEQALRMLDPAALSSAIDSIRPTEPGLAAALTPLAESFQYQDLLDLVRSADDLLAPGGGR